MWVASCRTVPSWRGSDNIPAVLGTGDITDRVRSGQQISVDGTAGVVTIVGGDGDDN